MELLDLESFQSPGDITVMTGAVRDLHRAHPGRFQTGVRTTAMELWENNPYVTTLQPGTPAVRTIRMQYPLIHYSNSAPFHFLHAYVQFLEEQLGLRIPMTKFRGDVHLSAAEKTSEPLNGHPLPEPYWLIVAGGKYDFTAKWWNPDSYQKLIDHFAGRITFVQCGEAGHWHPALKGAINLVGKTTTRQFVRLMHHAAGVVCPVTFAMHLAAAVETRPGRPKNRPCVVLAGGREPMQWEAYPHHQYISTNGMLSCCQEGGCWKSRCQLVGDGDAKDRQDVCEQPVQIRPDLRIPRCMEMIRPEDVIRRIEMYYEGGAMSLSNGSTLEPKDDTPIIDVKPDILEVSVEKNLDRELPGLAREISISRDGDFWCLGIGEFPLGNSIHRWNQDHWDHLTGSAIRIAVGPTGETWIIDRQNRLFSYRDGNWDERPGEAREVAIGPDGSVWSIDKADFAPGGGAIRQWSRDGWRQIEGAAIKIAVGPEGKAWIVNSAGRIFRQSGEGWELLPGVACELSIGPDGIAWCLSRNAMPDGGHSIHRWNGSDWDHITGSAVKIAAGTNGTLYIVRPNHRILQSDFAAE